MTALVQTAPSAPPDSGTRAGPERLLHEWFLDGLGRNPEGTALQLGQAAWTYRELDRLARRWAAALHQCTTSPPRHVGVLAGKSREGYLGVLASLYAGAAFVPLGPDVPVERNLAIARAAGIDVVVAEPGASAVLKELLAALPGVASVDAAAADEGSLGEMGPSREASPDDLAYILFTSGSTGAPKGVPISHRNISSFLAARLPHYDFTPEDRFSQVHELTFDLAMWDMWAAWASGGVLCAITRLQALHPSRCARDLGLTVWLSTPSLVTTAMAAGTLAPASLPGMRYSLFCGEPLTVETAAAWQQAAPESVIDNIYGPTEAAVAFTAYRCPPGPLREQGPTVPIGWPNEGMDCVLVDEDGRPVDVEGELCTDGAQRFPGYLNPADDVGRFVALDGRVWYRTGDRVRLTEAGFVHLGRNDSQVKLRGYRVELGEVERALCQAASAADAVAFVVGPRADKLVAFVFGPGAAWDPAAADALARKLPHYMLPAQVWARPEAPLNRNGKMDRTRLRAKAEQLADG